MKKLSCIISIIFAFGCNKSSDTTPFLPHKNLIKPEIKEIIDNRISKGINQGIIMGFIDSTGIDVYANGIKSKISKAIPDEKTLFEIGSITKVFTGLLLAIKATNEECSLHDPISDFLPDSISRTKNINSIRLHHLATHTSGLSRNPGNLHSGSYNPTNPYAHYNGAYLMNELEKVQLAIVPGEKSQYSNLGVGLLGYLISNQEGKSYFESVYDHILTPLDMLGTKASLNGENVATGYSYNVPVESHDFDALAGSGILKSNIHDMLLFLSAQLGFFATPLAEAINLSQQAHFKASSERAIGLGWGIYHLENGERLFRHNGGTAGFRSFIGFLEQAREGVIVLTNSPVGVDDIGLHQLDEAFELVTNHRMSIAYKVSEIIETHDLNQLEKSIQEILDSPIDSLNRDWNELNNLGYTYLKKREYRKAIEVFKLNIEIHPGSADGYDSLGEAYFENDQYNKALKNYQKALNLNPDYENPKNMIQKISNEMNAASSNE